MARVLVGCDVGGTFTDAVVVRDGGTDRARAKAPTTPGKLEEGALDAILKALGALEADPEDVEMVVHGTTVATNALLEEDLATVALVTNEGFRDVLEIGRQTREDLYDLDAVGPDPVVPRRLRFEVPGRLDAEGRELEPVKEETIQDVAEVLAGSDVDAVAVCLLNAHRSSAHEDRVAELLRDRLSKVHVETSHGTSPELREVERFTTTVVNAGLTPLVDRYLDRLEDHLREEEVQARLRVMDSAGGLVRPAEAARFPVRLSLSGPAGGVAAMRNLSQSTGEGSLLGVDMGGTSTDVSLLVEGEPTTRWETRVAGRRLQIPAADVHTVGAGGGSVAWVDEAGGLRVGPRSQGADPGPAAYGKGGTEATVTDANVVLGRVPEDIQLGDEISLVGVSARDAVRSVADRLDRGMEETAAGIIKIAIARTVRGMRALVARHGADPSDLTLVAFGGAGPQFGAEWATRLGAPRVLIPRGAGVTSAMGLLAAPPRAERARSLVRPLEGADSSVLAEKMRSLEQAAVDALGEEAAGVDRLVSARYQGQSHELTMGVDTVSPGEIRKAFEHAHERRHGYRLEGAPVEAVTLRARAWSAPALEERAGKPAKPRGQPEWEETVRAWHEGPKAKIPTRVTRASALAPGHSLSGPALITGPDTTIVIPPAWEAQVHQGGHLLMEKGGAR